MSEYYCNRCGARRGLLRRVPEDLISTPYQLSKFVKHTVLNSQAKYLSTFLSTSTGDYGSLVVASVNAGSVELDDRGRTNVIFRAGRPTGRLFSKGQFIQVQPSVCVVLTSSTGEVHAFPDSDDRYRNERCRDCGAPI